MISLAMIVKNEEQYLARCIHSAAAMVDEIVVVDTGSTDRTVDIALEYGAKVFHFEWCDDFAAARNYALEMTSGKWILVLDADEYFVEANVDALRGFTSTNIQRVGVIDMVSRFVEDGQIFEGRHTVPRLFPRGITYVGRIHEQLTPLLPRAATGLKLLHDGYYMTDKSTRNIPLLLKALEDEPEDAYLNFQLGKQYQGAKQHEQAMQYLESAYGLLEESDPFALETIVELLQAYTKCKRYDRALQLAGAEVKRLEESPDFCFATAQFLLDYAIDSEDYSVIENIENSYLKCLELGRQGVPEFVVGCSSFLAAYNLGVFYEVIGNIARAQQYYALSASHGYELAVEKCRTL
ncbi:glycosyltransferase [Cohnella soli]|uniref:Glycosyltransferase n=1 Tax=Cohnella soli TaxID=425005 RepID=A0ABW0HPG4_9BACL